MVGLDGFGAIFLCVDFVRAKSLDDFDNRDEGRASGGRGSMCGEQLGS